MSSLVLSKDPKREMRWGRWEEEGEDTMALPGLDWIRLSSF